MIIIVILLHSVGKLFFIHFTSILKTEKKSKQKDLCCFVEFDSSSNTQTSQLDCNFILTHCISFIILFSNVSFDASILHTFVPKKTERNLILKFYPPEPNQRFYQSSLRLMKIAKNCIRYCFQECKTVCYRKFESVKSNI